jgi:regulator of protease activity HflC (stomatin/prohibitin superfamily)
MKGDYLTYRRGTSVSLLGLLLQAGMAVGVLIYGRVAGDHAAITLSIFMGVGLIVWLGLALFYDQQRRERIEAMEAEALAVETGASSAFESGAEDLRVAARRVQTIQKWVLPVLAVVIAAMLIAFGFIRQSTAQALTDHDNYGEARFPGWGIAIGLGVAFVGFVFARFVSGMGKQSSWTALRAGAAQSVGGAIGGFAIATANFIELAIGVEEVAMYLPSVLAIAMVIIGGEIALNVLLDLYRPRKAGEELRPGFDSRILGFVAAPDKMAESIGDALSYQFGVDVTGSWFYRLLRRSVILLLVMGLLIGWAMTTLVIVEPHQRALILTNGEISKPLISFGEQGEQDVGPGLHIKYPWPFGEALVPEFTTTVPGQGQAISRTTTGVRTLHLGTNPPEAGNSPILWTEKHTTDEVVNIVQPAKGDVDEENDAAAKEGMPRRGDVALVAVEVPVQFVVRDLVLYEQLAGPGQRESVLRAIGQRVVMRHLSALRLDEILTGERTELAADLRIELERAFGELNDGKGAGVELVFVGAGGVHPPEGVAEPFERLIQARQNYESVVESAEGAQIETLTSVAGSVDLATQIVEQLDELEAMRESGAPAAEITRRQLAVQRLLETAGGEAGKMLIDATAVRWERHMGERAKATLFEGQSAAYRAAPELFQSRLYLEALSDAMRDARVFINGVPDAKVRIDLNDRRSGLGDFGAETGG